MVSRRFYRSFRRLNPGPVARVAIIGGLALHGAGIALLSVRVGSIVDLKPAQPFVSWVDLSAQATDPALRVQAMLFDSEPLFMPTRWNYAGAYDDVASLQKASELFRPFPAMITVDTGPLRPRPFAGNTDPLRLRATLLDSEVGALRLFGRSGSTDQALPSRLFAVEARDRLSGQSFSVAVESSSGNQLGDIWRPAVFNLQILPSGPAGEPVLVESSGVPDLDDFFAEYLAGLDFTRRIPPGYYAVTIGP